LLLTIEKLIYGGDGLARLPVDSASESGKNSSVPRNKRARHGAPTGTSADDSSRGKAVFLPFVLEEERVEAVITEQRPGFARARAASIVEASSHRVEHACPYFTGCGGCHYQHSSYEHQLQIKREILRETLRRVAKVELSCEIEVHASPPWNYRNRSRLQIRTRPEFTLGYFMGGSQDVLAVEECPISSSLINRGIAAVWMLGRDGKVPVGVNEIEFFANAEDSGMLVEIHCLAEARRAAIRGFAEELSAVLPETVGVVGVREDPHHSRAERAKNGAPGSGNRRSGLGQGPRGAGQTEKIVSVGEPYLTYRTSKADYRVSAGSFFQTNRFLIDELVRIVAEGRSGELALDLYSGVGLFSTALAGDIRHIVSVESSQTSSGDLSYNRTPNTEAVQATTEQYLADRANSGRFGKGVVLPHTSYQPDLAVVDPPRSGLGERVTHELVKLGAPVLIYVSCDPATLARDLVPLLASKYRVERAQLVDLFPQTFHIESVLELRK